MTDLRGSMWTTCRHCGGELADGHVCDGAMVIAHERQLEQQGREVLGQYIRSLLREIGRFPSTDERLTSSFVSHALGTGTDVTAALLLAQLAGVKVAP